jgi:hypothetical protein
MADRKLLRLSATLLFIGELLLGGAQFLHPACGKTYEATFADYAASGDWVAIHLGQGWVIGNEGYSSTDVVLAIAGFILLAAWSIWLLIVA